MTDPTSPESQADDARPEPPSAQVNVVQLEDSQPVRGQTNAAVLARGRQILSLLSQQAVAARAEAQCAELRILLGEAQVGEPSQLQRWLRIHAAECLSEHSAEYPAVNAYRPADASPLSIDALRFHCASGINDELGGSDDELGSQVISARSADQQRSVEGLTRRVASEIFAHTTDSITTGNSATGNSPTGNSPTGNSATGNTATGNTATGNTAQGPVGSLPSTGLSDWQTLLAPARERLHQRVQGLALEPPLTREQPADQQAVEKPSVEKQSVEKRPESKRASKLASGALGQTECRQPQPQQPQQHQRQLAAWRVRGALASMVAHGLLLLVLAWMTLRLPTPPAALELQASPVQSLPDAVEVSQPLELSSPEQAVENNTTVAAVDLSQMLSQVSSDITPTLAGHGPPLSSGLPGQSLLAAHAGGLGMPQSNTTFFGAAASGNCFCYVIDGSGSMRNGPWEAARFELLKSLSSLTDKQRFYIIFFNREVSAIPLPGQQVAAPSALYASQENLVHTRRWLDTLRIGIGAPPTDALAMAIDKEPDAIYLLTDGVTSVDVAKFLRERNRISDVVAGEQVRVPIHTIAFYTLEGQAMLRQLAAENAGQFTYVPDPRR